MNNIEKIISTIPPEKGSYILLFQIQETNRILVGSLGYQLFPAGIYAYAGSALGPGGVRARVRHHLIPARKPHWHMDYLKPSADWLAVGWTITLQRQECIWAQQLILAGGKVPAKGFGASDCQQGCPAHLIMFDSSAPLLLENLQIEEHIDIMYNKANF